MGPQWEGPQLEGSRTAPGFNMTHLAHFVTDAAFMDAASIGAASIGNTGPRDLIGEAPIGDTDRCGLKGAAPIGELLTLRESPPAHSEDLPMRADGKWKEE